MNRTAKLWLVLVALFLLLPRTTSGQPQDEKFPGELVKFTPMGAEPVFTAAKGAWDDKIRERGWIMREAGLWKLWYTGYAENGSRMLGYATSKDGIAWSRYAGNPIYKEHWVEDMMIV